MKNAEMNKTKEMCMGETALVLVKKNKYGWVITYLQVSQSGQLYKSLTQLTINEIC